VYNRDKGKKRVRSEQLPPGEENRKIQRRRTLDGASDGPRPAGTARRSPPLLRNRRPRSYTVGNSSNNLSELNTRNDGPTRARLMDGHVDINVQQNGSSSGGVLLPHGYDGAIQVTTSGTLQENLQSPMFPRSQFSSDDSAGGIDLDGLSIPESPSPEPIRAPEVQPPDARVTYGLPQSAIDGVVEQPLAFRWPFLDGTDSSSGTDGTSSGLFSGSEAGQREYGTFPLRGGLDDTVDDAAPAVSASSGMTSDYVQQILQDLRSCDDGLARLRGLLRSIDVEAARAATTNWEIQDAFGLLAEAGPPSAAAGLSLSRQENRDRQRERIQQIDNTSATIRNLIRRVETELAVALDYLWQVHSTLDEVEMQEEHDAVRRLQERFGGPGRSR
jgi:hypothetical protein